jgi:SAM-dependent methyltransferase
MTDIFSEWVGGLEARHLANLRVPEVTRALRALSSAYVERRRALARGAALDSAGKRAAYALYYGPLHYLTVQAIVRELPGALDPITHLADWGCGTGAAGAAWAATVTPSPRITAVDTHPWALKEAAATYSAFGLNAEVRRGDVARTRIPTSADAVMAGWVMNEISDTARAELLPRLLDLAARGTRILIVEPIATRVSPWWPEWAEAFGDAGGRSDEWKLPAELPTLIRRLDKSSGLRHDQLKARSLFAGR